MSDYVKELEDRNQELEEIIARLEDENSTVLFTMRKMIEECCAGESEKWTTCQGSITFFSGDFALKTRLLGALNNFEESFDFHSGVKKLINLKNDAIKYKRLYNKTKKELNKLQQHHNKNKFKFNRKNK